MSQTPSRKCIPRQSGTPDLEEVIPRRRSARLLAKARTEAATASSHSSNPVGNSYSFPAQRGTSAPFYPKVPNGESRHRYSRSKIKILEFSLLLVRSYWNFHTICKIEKETLCSWKFFYSGLILYIYIYIYKYIFV